MNLIEFKKYKIPTENQKFIKGGTATCTSTSVYSGNLINHKRITTTTCIDWTTNTTTTTTTVTVG